VANIGDSRCLLGHINGSVEPLSRDHKPDNEEEKTRILAAAGKVRMNRIDGDLSLSRAFGDFYYKSNASVGEREQKVIAVPEYRVAATTDDDHFVFLACDGVYDVMTNQEIVLYIREAITKQFQEGRSDSEIDLGEIAGNLIDRCLEKKESR